MVLVRVIVVAALKAIRIITVRLLLAVAQTVGLWRRYVLQRAVLRLNSLHCWPQIPIRGGNYQGIAPVSE